MPYQPADVEAGLGQKAIKMDGYEVGSAPFYASQDRSVLAYMGTSTKRSNLPIIAACSELTLDRYQASLAWKLNEVLNIGLELASEAEKRHLNILETLLDLRGAPQRYCLTHILHSSQVSSTEEDKEKGIAEREEELSDYFTRLTSEREGLGAFEPYKLDSKPFYVNANVRFFQGISFAHNRAPIVAKLHDFSSFEGEKLGKKLGAAINAGLAEARLQHPHICKILALYLDTTAAPTGYSLYHILEPLKCDVGMEVEQRRRENRAIKEEDLWEFLRQTSSALAFAHSKVVLT